MHLAHHLIYKEATDDYNYQSLIDKGLMTPAVFTHTTRLPRLNAKRIKITHHASRESSTHT
jgi:hypothetical protein